MNTKKIIVALDGNNKNKIIKLTKSIKREVFAFKIGYEFFLNFGLTIFVSALLTTSLSVFISDLVSVLFFFFYLLF